MTDRTYTAKDLADLFQIHETTVLRKAKSGTWPHLNLGPQTKRFTEEHLARILAMHEAKPPAERRRRTKHSYP